MAASAPSSSSSTSIKRSTSSSVVCQLTIGGTERHPAVVERGSGEDASVGEQRGPEAAVQVIEPLLRNAFGPHPEADDVELNLGEALEPGVRRRSARRGAVRGAGGARPSLGDRSARRLAGVAHTARARARREFSGVRKPGLGWGSSAEGRYGAPTLSARANRAGSRTNETPQSYGTFSHLCASTVIESACSTPSVRWRDSGAIRAKRPNAPSTCSQARPSRVSSAICAMGSKSPALTSPALAITIAGCVVVERGGERVEVHAPCPVAREPSHVAAAQAEHSDRLDRGRVDVAAGQDPAAPVRPRGPPPRRRRPAARPTSSVLPRGP